MKKGILLPFTGFVLILLSIVQLIMNKGILENNKMIILVFSLSVQIILGLCLIYAYLKQKHRPVILVMIYLFMAALIIIYKNIASGSYVTFTFGLIYAILGYYSFKSYKILKNQHQENKRAPEIKEIHEVKNNGADQEN